jgi:xylulokinase
MRVNLMKATGGGANSRIWQQIVADITQIPVEIPISTQSASWGAAVLAAMGVGVDALPEKTGKDEEKRTLKPTHSDLYDNIYMRYRNLRELTAQHKI